MHSWIDSATPLAVLIALAALVTSWAATGIVRRYALSRAILDVPNHRSSHTVPTPRGGGLAILVAVPMGIFAAWKHGSWFDRGIMALYHHLILKIPIVNIDYMPIDIITKENYEFYKN